MLDEILGARPHADAALAAARLPAIGIDRGALEVSAARDRHRHVFHRDQVFERDLAGVFDDLGAALVAELLLDFLQFLDDHVAQHLLGAENLQVLGDAALDVGQFVQDLLLLHAGQALQLQFDDGLRLLLGKLEPRRSALRALPCGFFAARISWITSSRLSQRLLEAEQDMLALAGLAQLIIGAPAHDIHAMSMKYLMHRSGPARAAGR